MPDVQAPRLTMPGEMLARELFARPALAVARDLLGCVLEHETPEGLVAVVLTEVEAYEGDRDPASHAYRGRTARNAVMFGPPGHAYVYFTYGMHFCVNLVCLPEGVASAVLLRAGRVVAGADLAAARRVSAGPGGRDLARGPARLCQALGIDRSLDGADVCDPGSPLRVRSAAAAPGLASAYARWEPDPRDAARTAPGARPAGAGSEAGDAGFAAGPRQVSAGPRVGVSAAADRPWRLWLTGDPTVSVYRPHTPRRRSRAGSDRIGEADAAAAGAAAGGRARVGGKTTSDRDDSDGTMQQ